MTVAYAVRLALRAGGYSPIPVRGKSPVLPNWQEKTDAGTADFNWWDERYAAATNTGVLTGPTPALDIDIKNLDAAVAVEEAVKDWVEDRGEVLIRFGNPPKRAISFRTDTPFPKILRTFQDAHGNTHRLEFLGEGQQIVVHGVHPDTSKPYSWHGNRSLDNVPREQLPPIDEAEARKLVDHCAGILVQQFGFAEVAPVISNGGGGAGGERGPVDAEAELAAMTPDNVNDVHVRVVPSLLWRAINPNEVVTQVAAATMAMARRHRLTDWGEEAETKNYVRPRVKSALKNLFMEKYDPTSGEIPPWLCPEWHEQWVAALARGEAPNIGCNANGFFIRAYDRNGKANGSEPAAAAPPLVPQEAGPRRRFPLIGFNELIPGDDPPFLVEDFLPRRGIALVWGKFKTLKSTFVLDLMLHVERGWKYRGLAVEQGTIIYAVFEGSHGYRTRVEALRRHYEISRSERVRLYVMPASLNLWRDKATLVQDLKVQLGDDKPIAIVLDTLNRSLDGSESNDEDMQRYIKAADHLRDIFDALVLIIHHCGHNEERPRGHSSLSGAIDCQIRIERQGDSMTAEVELMRDGPEGKQIHSILKQLDVHIAANGKVVTAPVVVPAEESRRAPKSMGKGTAADKFFQAIREATAQHGEEFQPDIGSLPVKAVEEGCIRHRFGEIYVPERADDDPTKRADAIRSAFNQIYKKARSKGIVDTRTPHGSGKTMVWLVPRD
jgi:hypothetical protein